MRRAVVTAAIGVMAALSLTACSEEGDVPESGGTNSVGELCSDLAQLKRDTVELTGLDGSDGSSGAVSRTDVQDAIGDIRDDWDDIEEAAFDLAEGRRTDLKDAVDDLTARFGRFPAGTSGTDAVDRLQPQIKAVDEAAEAASQDLECA